jgi:hypothetical protein
VVVYFDLARTGGRFILFIVSHYRWVAETVRRPTGTQLQ